MKMLNLITKILLVIGGLNWGLVGVAQFDLVAALFGDGSALARTVYSLVGISAVIQGAMLFGSSNDATHATQTVVNH
ncbi:MAG: DUF378 domain-containing protein [Armatimonadetes bacterium]|nr:MAG: DUF378 domain-containing protein [Armatimonadota bacterium]GIV01748.1 MAG: DUF378 domain-containing protein [Fimbriimonadales bacterium]